MRKRDPASAPNVGDRVAYVIVKGTKNSKLYDKNHLELGIASLREIIKYDDTNTVRHLKF